MDPEFEWQPIRIASPQTSPHIKLGPFHEKWVNSAGIIVMARPADEGRSDVRACIDDYFRRDIGCDAGRFFVVHPADAQKCGYDSEMLVCEHQILAD